MTKLGVSATIITLNEEENLTRAIQSLKPWVNEIIVVDSGSTDKTCEIAEKLGARVYKNEWLGYGRQKNFAQEKATQPWILNLDADEEVSDQLAQEIQRNINSVNQGLTPYSGFDFPRKTFYLGKWIRHGGWYPNHVTRIAKKSNAKWSEPHLHEELVVDGPVGRLKADLHHYTFSNIEDQVLTNLKYSRAGSRDLAQRGQKASHFKLIFKPVGKFLETYFWKLGFLDGVAGFIISINAAHSMFLKYSYLFEEKRIRL